MIRIRALELKNFKNVEQGRVLLSRADSVEDIGDGADVIGLYGQNGSGKTSFIQALSILKTLMSGEPLPIKSSEYVACDQDAFELSVEFFVAAGDDDALSDYILGISDTCPAHMPYIASYAVKVGACSGKSPLVLSESLSCKDLESGESLHEVFSWEVRGGASSGEPEPARASGISEPLTKLVESARGQWSYDATDIAPSTHWRALMGIDKTLSSRLEATRDKVFQQGESLLFSPGFASFCADMLNDGTKEISKAAAEAVNRVLIPSFSVAFSCGEFAKKDMAVLPTTHQGVLPLGYLPLASHEGERGDYVDNFMLLDIDSKDPMPAQRVDELERALENVNKVIGQIVPGLSVSVKRLGKVAGNNGETLESIELMSVRGESSVPLRNESEGIQKILSIVSLLIDVHTNPSAFVGIDELDSGVFEYLLGEILQAIAEHGFGQLVFTAHNLRPLEVLPSSSIWFTTVEPDRRYTKASGVRDSNNLRKMYLKDIRLGGVGDEVYVPTSPLRIDGALYDAGMMARDMRQQARG